MKYIDNRINANIVKLEDENNNYMSENVEGALEEINSQIKNIEANGYDDTQVRQHINNIKTEIGTEELTTNSKNIKGSVNELSSQIKDKVNKNIIDLNILDFGFIGDGVNDDASSIQRAIDYGTSLISGKKDLTDDFSGNIYIQLPPSKIYIKSQININNAVTINGCGSSTVLIISEEISCVFNFEKNTNSLTLNEENQVTGGGLTNLKISGGKRKYEVLTAVKIYRYDNFNVDNVWFYGIKGKCIELKTVRESNFNNIFIRFCGTKYKANIEIVKNIEGEDTTNLNFGNNWSIAFPYGEAIRFDTGDFVSINNCLIHGVFEIIYSKLNEYFGENDFILNNNSFIVLKNSSCTFNNLLTVYCPNKNAHLYLDNSKCYLNNSTFNSHYVTNQAHGSNDFFFALANNSNLYLGSNIKVDSARQAADIISCGEGCKVIGSLCELNDQWLNFDIYNEIVATNLVLKSDYLKPVTITSRNTQCAKIIENVGRILYDIRTPDDMNRSIIELGVDYNIQQPLCNIPDGTIFRLSNNDSSTMQKVNNTLFVENGFLKLIVNGNVKTIAFLD